MEYKITSIGIIKSPFKTQKEAPRQGINSEEISKIVLHDEFTESLEGIRCNEHIIVLYWMHLADRKILRSESKKKGVFATRSPDRPNPIGIAVVKVVKIEDNVLYVKYLDAIDNTPVIDIKPINEQISFQKS